MLNLTGIAGLIHVNDLNLNVWEGARHGDYGSFRFQMSHEKMPGGDYMSHYIFRTWRHSHIQRMQERECCLIQNFAKEI